MQKGLALTRMKANSYIMSGEIWVNGKCADKAGAQVDEAAVIEHRPTRAAYVSRGGYKIEGAARAFGLDFSGRVVLDVGASTGGYTDFALQNGAKKVYAVDVGYGQLDWGLRNRPEVIVRERVNARYLTQDMFEEPIDLVLMDVSFISITLILPGLIALLAPFGEIVTLIKPQFETSRPKVGKKGVVRDPAIHEAVLLNCIQKAEQLGLSLAGCCHSPIKGAKGNIEYFLYLRLQALPQADPVSLARAVVQKARQELEE